MHAMPFPDSTSCWVCTQLVPRCVDRRIASRGVAIGQESPQRRIETLQTLLKIVRYYDCLYVCVGPFFFFSGSAVVLKNVRVGTQCVHGLSPFP